MSREKLSYEEQLSRYLSTEWTVAEETAVNITRFAKLLVGALEEASKAMKAAMDEGDLETFSSSLTGMIQMLRVVGSKVDQVETESYAHYVELLGSREEMLRMARLLEAFYNDGDEALGEATGFDDILRQVGGDEGIIH
jgi:hypothetical protein